MTFNTVSGKANLSYLGTSAVNPANVILSKIDPINTAAGPQGNSSTPYGTFWVNTGGEPVWMLVSSTGSSFQGTYEPTWVELGAGQGFVAQVLGTAAQITVVTAAGVATVSLPAAITAPGSLTTTTSLAATTTVTAGTGITATTGNIVASTGNITATLGNIAATAGSVSAGTTVAAGTTVTAGTGFIATAGNIALNGATSKIIISTGAAGSSIGTATLGAGGPGGTVTVNTSAVTAASNIFVSRNTTGGTNGNLACPTASIVPGVSFLITSDEADTSTVNWWIVN